MRAPELHLDNGGGAGFDVAGAAPGRSPAGTVASVRDAHPIVDEAMTAAAKTHSVNGCGHGFKHVADAPIRHQKCVDFAGVGR